MTKMQRVTMRRRETAAYAVKSILLREDETGARWYRTTMSDGRVLTMCVPGREEA